MQQHLGLSFPHPTELPADLVLLLRDVPPGQLTARTEAELRAIVEDPLIRAALEKFSARIINIGSVKPLIQAELF